MKKFVKSGIVAAMTVVAGFAAYQSYGSYNLQDHSLLMQNVEALADDNKGDSDAESGKENIRLLTCFLKVADRGIIGFACPYGTSSSNYKVCPSEDKIVSPLSSKSYCILR